MKYLCTPDTTLHDLIGQDSAEGFRYGPLAAALKSGEELVLEASHVLPPLMPTKIDALLGRLFIVETEETLRTPPGFRLVLA
jgi:hypothetical protein